MTTYNSFINTYGSAPRKASANRIAAGAHDASTYSAPRASRRLRRSVIGLAWTGGGLGALSMAGAAALYGILQGESMLVRNRIPKAPDTEGGSYRESTWVAEGVRGRRHAPLRVAILGDSTAAGYGVQDHSATPGVRLALGISAIANRPVQLTTVAVVGAQSTSLHKQLALLPTSLDLAIIMIGANDITHQVRQHESVHNLRNAVLELTGRGIEVVVGTCPDLGSIPPLAEPLRSVARLLSRRLARAQAAAVAAAGGRTVPLGDLLGPLFSADSTLFGEDRFHPSERGYAAAAQVVLPTALDALGLNRRASFPSGRPDGGTRRRIRPAA